MYRYHIYYLGSIDHFTYQQFRPELHLINVYAFERIKSINLKDVYILNRQINILKSYKDSKLSKFSFKENFILNTSRQVKCKECNRVSPIIEGENFKVFDNMGWSTSRIDMIVDKNMFLTRNSIYYVSDKIIERDLNINKILLND